MDERVWNPVVCVKNVGAGAGNEHMDMEGRVEAEVPLQMLRTMLQGYKKSLCTFRLYQDSTALWFLNETQCLIALERG